MSALPETARSSPPWADAPVDCGPPRGGGIGWVVLAFLGTALAVGIIALLVHAVVPNGPGPWLFWPFFPFGFFFLVFLIVWLGRWGGWGWGPRWRVYRSELPDAASILAVRYARGEIGREQYLEMRRLLEHP